MPGWKSRLPNLLTLARIALAAAFVVVLSRWNIDASPARTGNQSAIDSTLLLCAGLFVVAAITDALDGFLARRWNAVSVFGRVMDPFADKVLVLGGFVLLAGPAFTSRLIPDQSFACVAPWMVIVILARELLVTSLRAVVESRGVSFAATTSGKLKMILQSICIPLVLVLIASADTRPGIGPDASSDGLSGATPGARMIIMLMVWLTVIATAWSAVPYLTRAVRALR